MDSAIIKSLESVMPIQFVLTDYVNSAMKDAAYDKLKDGVTQVEEFSVSGPVPRRRHQRSQPRLLVFYLECADAIAVFCALFLVC